jgi:hypothetical protein
METVAISLRELEKTNSPAFNKRGLNCIVHLIDYERVLGEVRYLFLVQGLESYSHDGGHIVSLLFDKGSAKFNKSRPLVDDVKLHCQCPAYVYWGAKFNATEGEYNLDEKEDRAPDIRDPHREVKICKHVARVIRSIRSMTYDRLDDRANRKIKAALEADFKLIPIEETFKPLIGYLERHHKDIEPNTFVNQLTRANYAQSLLAIGAIK